MFHKSVPSIILFVLLGAAFFLFPGCDTSEVNKQDSVTSGTSTGYGSSGGAAAHVSVTSGNNPVGSSATTIITVMITDAAGKPTDASFILTSSLGGSFGGTTTNTNTTLTGSTLGGFFSTTFTAPANTSGSDVTTEIAATVSRTALRGSTLITITPVPTTGTP